MGNGSSLHEVITPTYRRSRPRRGQPTTKRVLPGCKGSERRASGETAPVSLSGSTPRLPVETPRGNWDSPEAAPRPEEEGPSALPWLLPAWRSGLERGDVRDRYHVIPQELGRGCYGVVRRCRERATGRALALKTVPKARVRRPEALRREARVLAVLDHPNIVRLEAAYEDERYVHLVQELCAGGELFDQIVARARRSGSYAAFGEAEAARLFAQILDAVAYLHARGVVHRDLKPENFLFLADAPGAPLKLVDFGLCALKKERKRRK